MRRRHRQDSADPRAVDSRLSGMSAQRSTGVSGKATAGFRACAERRAERSERAIRPEGKGPELALFETMEGIEGTLARGAVGRGRWPFARANNPAARWRSAPLAWSNRHLRS